MKRNLYLATLFALTSICLCAQNSNTIVSGTVGGHWLTDTVTVTGDLFLQGNDSLIIDAGTFVLFTGHYRFEVKGYIKAIGTESDTIRFTVTDTTGFSDTLTPSGGWHGFVYDHMSWSADSSIFKYCTFEYGKAFSADTFGQYGGAFRILDFGKIAFRNCTFTSNMAIRWGGAVYSKNADLLFDRCAFRDNWCGLALLPWGYGGGICSVNSEPVVLHCLFEGNRATGFGGGASFEYSDPVLRFNTFYGNFGGLAGGFGFLRSTPTQVVSNNLVYSNEAKFFGGGVACIRANTVFANNTITGNTSIYGGGFYCNDSAVPILYNTILYGNQGFGHEVYIWDVRSAPSFHYCLVEGDTSDFEGSGAHEGYLGSFTNNLDADPQYRMTGTDPFALLSSSPCIDSGTPDTLGLSLPDFDLEGLMRIWNGRVDIGAYEWNPGQGIGMSSGSLARLKAFPNPASDYIVFQTKRTQEVAGDLRVYDVHGRQIVLIPPQYEGELIQFRFDLSGLKGSRLIPGTYFAKYGDAVALFVVK